MAFYPDKPADSDAIRLGAGQIRENFKAVVNDGIVVAKPPIYGESTPGDSIGANFERYIDTLTGNEYVKENGAWQLKAVFSAPVEEAQMLGNVQGTTTINAAAGNIVTLRVTGDLAISLEASVNSGYCRVLTLMITNGGAYLVTWPTTINWADDTVPMLSANGTDLITLFTVDDGGNWLGMLSGGGFN